MILDAPAAPLRGKRPAWTLLAALVVWIAVAATLAWKIDVRGRLGDTDDATRLVMVRALAAGQGWYDQLVTRLAPPQGVYMHWSRLIDGGLALLLTALRGAFGPIEAEWLMRVIWPLSWILPALLAALALTRRLGGRHALLIGAVLMAFYPPLFGQFTPGRIDHHNVQIVAMLAALSFAVASQERSVAGLWAGLSTAAGLAVGLESLAFHALIGAGMALSFASDRRRGRAVTLYGLGLAAGAAALFLVQTPPWRWTASACDALAPNLVVALAAGGAGLALAGRRGASAWPARLIWVGAAGAAAAIAYVALDPACLYGPFARVDPLVKRLWLDKVQEVQPLWRVWKISPDGVVGTLVLLVMGSACAIGLGWGGGWRRLDVGLTVALFAASAVLGVLAWRMTEYMSWLAMILIAAGLSRLADRRLGGRLAPALALALVLSPLFVGAALNKAIHALWPSAKPDPAMAAQERCFTPRAYAQLSRLPQGRVLSAPDLGPFVLAFTHHSALAAPYHRLSGPLRAAMGALDSAPAAAHAKVQALGARYVVDCPLMDTTSPPSGLIGRLRAGQAPAWLSAASAPGAVLKIYQVRPS